jgi:hypothetical protein
VSSRRTIRKSPWQSRTTALMEPIGAWPRQVVDVNSLKNMVGPCGLEPQTSTVSTLAGASVIFEERGVLCSGATWKQRDKECTGHYQYAADRSFV